MIEDFKINNGDITACNHRPTSPNTSLLFIEPMFMVTPVVVPAVCKCCGKSFEFSKNEETGKWVNIKNIKH